MGPRTASPERRVWGGGGRATSPGRGEGSGRSQHSTPGSKPPAMRLSTARTAGAERQKPAQARKAAAARRRHRAAEVEADGYDSIVLYCSVLMSSPTWSSG